MKKAAGQVAGDVAQNVKQTLANGRAEVGSRVTPYHEPVDKNAIPGGGFLSLGGASSQLGLVDMRLRNLAATLHTSTSSSIVDTPLQSLGGYFQDPTLSARILNTNITLVDTKVRAVAKDARDAQEDVRKVRAGVDEANRMIDEMVRDHDRERFRKIEEDMEARKATSDMVDAKIAEALRNHGGRDGIEEQVPGIIESVLQAVASVAGATVGGLAGGAAAGAAGAAATGAIRGAGGVLGGVLGGLATVGGLAGAAWLASTSSLGRDDEVPVTTQDIEDWNREEAYRKEKGLPPLMYGDPMLHKGADQVQAPPVTVEGQGADFVNLMSENDRSRFNDSNQNFIGDFTLFNVLSRNFWIQSERLDISTKSDASISSEGVLRLSSTNRIVLEAPAVEIIGMLINDRSRIDREYGSGEGEGYGAGGYGGLGDPQKPKGPRTGFGRASNLQPGEGGSSGGGFAGGGISGTGGETGATIASGESGGANYNAYNTGTAGKYGGPIDFSQYTLGEVMAMQSSRKVFAVGRYQIVPGTMKEAVAALGLDPNQQFSPEMQEMIYREYLIAGKRPAIKRYITGESDNLTAANLAFAQEFAAVADPNTGRSYYDGVAGNSSSISPAQMQKALKEERRRYQENIAAGMSPDEAWSNLSGTVVGGGGATQQDTVADQSGQFPGAPMTHSNQTSAGVTRDDPITSDLQRKIQEAVYRIYGPGYTVDVYSGGQEHGHGVGSTRHDDGKAADVHVTGPDGKRISGDGLSPLVQYWIGSGYGGAAAGMGGGGIHLDEHSSRAPTWMYKHTTGGNREAAELGKKGILPDNLYDLPKQEAVQVEKAPEPAFTEGPVKSGGDSDRSEQDRGARGNVPTDKPEQLNIIVKGGGNQARVKVPNTHDGVNMSASGLASYSSGVTA